MFALCRQISPYLNGQLESDNSDTFEQDWIKGSDGRVIERLYTALQQTSPEAGSAYWMTRSWDLLCWQPIYIAFISIYGLQQLPDFSQFKQRFQHNSVFGFAFHSEQLCHGTAEVLIAQAGVQLSSLLNDYRQQLNRLVRCRPGYVKRLLSDLILDSLLKVRDNVAEFSDQDVQHHAQLWLHALDISTNIQHALIVTDTLPITHARSSCCLTYKANNDLCPNCPKKDKLKLQNNKNDNL